MPTELHDLSVAIGELPAADSLDALGRQTEELPMSGRPGPTAMKPENRHHAAARRRIAGGAAGSPVGWLFSLPRH